MMGPLPFGLEERLLERALLASLALHLLFAVVLPIWTPLQPHGLLPVESISFARVMRAQIERPARAALPVAVPATHRRSAHVTFERKKSELAAKARARHSRPLLHAGPAGQTVAAAPKKASAQTAAPLLARAPSSVAPVAAAHGVQSSAKPDAAVDTRTITSAGTSDRGGVMPFGAEQTPVLDPAVRAQLAQMARAHVTLSVTVGEDGKTKFVKFDPPLDAQTERAMQNVLAQATWDAAVCGGGVSCEGVATIKL
ncbi:MAG: hypothetical protein ABR508_00275 [Candidatus Baltobacteraceae bacterium]